MRVCLCMWSEAPEAASDYCMHMEEANYVCMCVCDFTCVYVLKFCRHVHCKHTASH